MASKEADPVDRKDIKKSTECESLTRKEWILALLYAPIQGEEAKPVYGSMRLMQLLFLLHKKVAEGTGIETNFDFEPDLFGPVDTEAYSDLTTLLDEGYIAQVSKDRHNKKRNGDEFKLTFKGKERGGEEYKSLCDDHKRILNRLREENYEKPLGTLLSEVYSNYPDMFY